MIKVILVLVYLWQSDPVQAPELKVEQTVYDTQEACMERGGKKAVAIGQDPKFVEGYYAGCIPSRVTVADK